MTKENPYIAYIKKRIKGRPIREEEMHPGELLFDFDGALVGCYEGEDHIFSLWTNTRKEKTKQVTRPFIYKEKT